MLVTIKTELWKLKRYNMIWAGILLMLLAVLLTIFTTTALDGTVWTFSHFAEQVMKENITTIFPMCIALIRLAYFNVLEEERQNRTEEKRKSYLGIPVTNIAILLPACYLLFSHRLLRHVICFPILLVLLGAGFLLPIEIKKPGVAGKIAIVLAGILEAAFMIFIYGMGYNVR